MAAYLEAALDDGDPILVAAALGDLARQRHGHRLRAKPALAGKACTRLSHLPATPSSQPS
jgi:DNA-binding phage protein